MENFVLSHVKSDNFNRNHRKEPYFTGQITAIVVDGEHTFDAVTLRVYNTQAMSYACLWTHGHGFGSGKAGGYGYHRVSSATEQAIKGAGFELRYSIAGVGDSAMKGALIAIAKHLYPGKAIYLHEAHA